MAQKWCKKYYSHLRPRDGLEIDAQFLTWPQAFWLMSLPRQGHLELVVQDCVQMALQHLKEWRLPSFFVAHHPNVQPSSLKKKKKYFLMSRRIFTCFSLCPLPYILKARGPWGQWDLTLHSKVKTQMRIKALENASYCNYAKYEVRSVSENWSLHCLYDADRLVF